MASASLSTIRVIVLRSVLRLSIRIWLWPIIWTWLGICFLGREEVMSFGRLDETAMEQRALETLDSLSVTTIRSVRQAVAGLSGGQRQAIAVAKAVMWNSKLVILDEPTAALGVAQDAPSIGLGAAISRSWAGRYCDYP